MDECSAGVGAGPLRPFPFAEVIGNAPPGNREPQGMAQAMFMRSGDLSPRRGLPDGKVADATTACRQASLLAVACVPPIPDNDLPCPSDSGLSPTRKIV